MNTRILLSSIIIAWMPIRMWFWRFILFYSIFLVLGHGILVQTTQTNPVEKNVLLDFYHAFNLSKPLWNISTDPCTPTAWTGITCSSTTNAIGFYSILQIQLVNGNYGGNEREASSGMKYSYQV